MKRIANVCLALAALASLGCYAYLPTPNNRPSPGNEVQLGLTDSGTVVLARLVGPSVGSVTGRFAGDSAGTYLLDVTHTARRDGTESDWRGERIAVDRALVTDVTTRRFSPGRTIVFGGLTTGALIAIVEAFAGGGGASAPGGPLGTQTGR
jgi:hypothetical protein